MTNFLTMSHTVTHHFFFERVDFRRVRKEDLEKNIFSTVGVAKWVLGGENKS